MNKFNVRVQFKLPSKLGKQISQQANPKISIHDQSTYVQHHQLERNYHRMVAIQENQNILTQPSNHHSCWLHHVPRYTTIAGCANILSYWVLLIVSRLALPIIGSPNSSWLLVMMGPNCIVSTRRFNPSSVPIS